MTRVEQSYFSRLFLTPLRAACTGLRVMKLRGMCTRACSYVKREAPSCRRNRRCFTSCREDDLCGAIAFFAMTRLRKQGTAVRVSSRTPRSLFKLHFFQIPHYFQYVRYIGTSNDNTRTYLRIKGRRKQVSKQKEIGNMPKMKEMVKYYTRSTCSLDSSDS